MCKGLATLPATCLKSAKDIKHKISFLLQKPEHQATDQKQMKEKAATSAKRTSNTAEVEKWKECFSHVMSSDTGRTVFTNFLRSEFSQENMDFWIACEDYKKTAASKLASRAKQIYQLYVEEDAPHEVNLDAATREETRRNVESACPSCFDGAQKTIYNLMEKDSYRRFLRSDLTRDLCRKQSGAAREKTNEKRGWAGDDGRRALTNGA
ncbi:regulator of G-protein signaling 4-like [Embiotoca jacksoni]|uniref:regulator of G-protein signaling 4-like n=1 Tax=Embiotoca jacksoni TaxID=100190 RepID=UPI003703DE07